MLALCVIVTYLLYGSYSHGQAVTSLEVISFPDSTSTFNSCIRSCLSIMPSYIGCARNSCLCQSTNIANHWAYVCAEQNNCAESPNNVPLSLYCQRYSEELAAAATATVAVTTTTPGGLYRVSFSISIANNIKHR